MVNTFIPYPSFTKVAKLLDNKRLCKQRVEAYQILNILLNKTKTHGWRHHVVVHMWRGYEPALKLYYNEIVKEWIRRGFKNNMALYKLDKKITIPWFVTNKSVNESHKASLWRKDKFYHDKLEVKASYLGYKYIWPSKLNEEQIQELRQRKNELVEIERFAEKID